ARSVETKAVPSRLTAYSQQVTASFSAISDRDETPPPPSCEARPGRPWRSHKERIAGLSKRIVVAQQPIRILNCIKWPNQVLDEFRRGGYRELPRIDYNQGDLGYDPDLKKRELLELEQDILREL